MSAFYLSAINRTLEVYSCTEVPEDDVLKLYGDPDLTKRALEKLEAQFEPAISLRQRIFRVTRREYQELSKAVLDFGEKTKDRDYDSFIALSYKLPTNISKEKIKKGWEIARSEQLLGGALEE